MRSVWPRTSVFVTSAGIAICVATAALVTHRDAAGHLLEILTSFPSAAIAGAVSLILLQVTGQALRLWAIIPRSAGVGVALAAHAFTLGECVNNLVPGRGGDAVKAVLMRPVGGAVRFPRAVGALVADKVIDGGAAALLCVITGAFGVVFTGVAASRPSTTVVGAVLLVALVLSVIAWLRPAWFERVRSAAREFVSGLSSLRRPGPVLASLTFGLIVWMAEALALRLLCGGVGFDPALSRLFLAIMLLNAGILVPISLANLGVYEATLTVGLAQAGIPVPAAVAIAIAHHGIQLFSLGLAALVWSLAVRPLRVGPRGSG